MPTTAINLTLDQQKALDAVNSERNVFITGSAGTGKSYLLRAIVYSLVSAGKNVIVCVPTGIAAANVAPYCTNPGQCYVALSRVRDI